jgi:hypothetical protein
MPIPETIAVRFTPRGVADAYDATDVFQGACRRLSNLVFDPSNPEVVIARPGVDSALTSFAGFSSPGFVSLQVTIGTRVYGMVATQLTAGFDQPFCYDLATASFVTVSGCTAGNAEGRPASPATTGAWTPPTMTIVGVKIIITHPGYAGTVGKFFGVIDITNPAAPAYTTANTATNLLPSVPTSVANLNNRCYFTCGNVQYYSDVLVPTTITNASQSLTVGDSSPVIGQSGLPVQTTTAGVVSALLLFKSTQIWQITGDAAVTGSLSLNYLSLNIGSSAPRSITPTPLGTFFAGPDSCYLINPYGAVMPVASQLGSVGASPDLRQPFGYITQPTRVAASFAGNIYRVCLPTIIDGIAGTYDYWFDTRKMRWNGPHTFNYDCASTAGTYFILTGYGTPNKLFRSDPYPNTNTIYTDNGVAFNVDMKSADFPKRDEMAMKQVVESTIELSSSGASVAYSVAAFDGMGNQITSASVTTAVVGGIWGSNIWGDGTKWASALNQPRTYQVYWPIPLVFNKMAIEVNAVASASVSIGTFYARTQKTGYTLQP